RWRSQILYVGTHLGVFETVDETPCDASEIARRLGTDPALTYRLLRALASLELLREDDARRFAIRPAGAVLRADHPQTLRGVALLEEGPEHYVVWKHLADIVRDGRQDGFVREFGRMPFEHVGADDGYRDVFNQAMSSYSTGETAMVLDALSACDLSEVASVCDVGGGHGHLLASLLAGRPNLRGTVYELPATIAARELLWADRLGVGDRCRYVAGDMFAEVPAADAYLMKHILHDWNDDECVTILGNCRRAARPGARVFVAEFVVPGPDVPHFGKLFDVHMMVALTGRERTEAEYEALLQNSGWRFVATRAPSAGPMTVVEGALA
ncbi:MAG: acetylserotonin O-methyltransferase, partial [Chloroflexi bacterium]|nr:acetylserotonin O-methyltransferase [Chloroflexota bacterium]